MSRRGKWILGISLTLMVFIALGLFAVNFLRRIGIPVNTIGFNREWDRAVKNGIPLSMDYRYGHPIPDSENAAVPLMRICLKVYDDLKKLQTDPKYHGAPLDTPEGEAINSKLVDPYLDDVVKATKIEKYWEKREAKAILEVERFEHDLFKRIVLGLDCRAVRSAQRGDLKACISDIRAGLRFSKFIGQGIDLTDYWCAAKMQYLQFRTIDRCIGAVQDDPDKVKQLLALIPEVIRTKGNLRQCILGEACNDYFYHLNHGRRVDEETGEYNKPLRTSGRPSGFGKAIFLHELRFWNAVVESKEWKSGDDDALVDAVWEIIAQNAKVQNEEPYLADYGTGSTLMVWLQRSTLARRTYGVLNLAYAEVVEFRMEHGRLPNTLAEARVQLDDPYMDGLPLHYWTDGKSFRIWSIGWNRIDDSGDFKKDAVKVYLDPRPITKG